MVEATEMLKFLGTLKDLKNSSITIICDRGYMSEDNVQRMDDASLNFLLMLKSNMNVTKDLLKKYAASVRSSAHYIPESDQYGMTVTDQLFVGDTRTRYFHIVWSSDREKDDHKTFFTKLAAKELRLRRKIERKEQVTYDEMMDFADWFKLSSTKAGTVPDNKKGRKASGETKEEESYPIFAIDYTHNLSSSHSA